MKKTRDTQELPKSFILSNDKSLKNNDIIRQIPKESILVAYNGFAIIFMLKNNKYVCKRQGAPWFAKGYITDITKRIKNLKEYNHNDNNK